ncbi:FAD binding domain-containing protein [Actinospica sp.]|uniref:FAD binding domain-containing protein n=1 Tax=Actinospica sp. TaxID=1872142 RepID=UPI002C4E5F46|nr:FAD binding domain-containing protein [Actinospica sp.]HWG24127.1 FAD binding domain-containing protein [Actinospica sp.]
MSVSTHVVALRPTELEPAVQALAAEPDLCVLAGGTELMVLANAGRLRPRGFLLIDRIPELRGVWFSEQEVIIGAATTCADLTHPDLRAVLPALAQAARAIGSAALRTRATLGGNLASGKRLGGGPAPLPGRDLLTALIALGAVAVCRTRDKWRQVPVADLYARDGGAQLLPGELITALRLPLGTGQQGFMKIGTRGGPGRPVLTLALVVDPSTRQVACAVGGHGPVPARVDHAGQWLQAHVDWEAGAIPDPGTYQTFARLVAEGLLAPLTAGPAGASTSRIPEEYRRKAAEVCARRALVRALPPSGWLEQVKQYQIKAELMRARTAVERAERGLPQTPPVPGPISGPVNVPGLGALGARTDITIPSQGGGRA